MPRTQALAIWKSILRNHPFFAEGGTFGFDWSTFHATDPYACAWLRLVVARAQLSAEVANA